MVLMSFIQEEYVGDVRKVDAQPVRKKAHSKRMAFRMNKMSALTRIFLTLLGIY